ncbi:hypothetical protein C0580_04830 [Candidatus Parcubacteria bacterium]|nr:MAG: hypothetical protein C0580_04830 [Candidatus Parcubacteria bacterium]
MNYKNYLQIRSLITLLIVSIISMAVISNNLYLAIVGIFIGVLFIFLVRNKFKKIVVDERVLSVSGKASRITYVIGTIFLALLGLFFIFLAKLYKYPYLESLGIVFSYIALLMITIYSISYHYYNREYGADE